jgi:WD40 repeat protein
VAWTAPGRALNAAFSPDGGTVALGSFPAVVKDVSSGADVRTLDADGPVAWDPDGTRLAASGEGVVRLLAAADGALLDTLDHPEDQKARRWTLAFSPDGQRLASATGQNGLGSPHGAVRLFDLNRDTLESLECTSMSAAFSPDGATLATACWQSVRLWDASSGGLTAGRIDTDNVLTVAWSPDGKTLALGTFGGGVKLMDPSDLEGAPRRVLPVLQAKAVAFTTDGTRLLAGGWTKPDLLVWTLPAD